MKPGFTEMNRVESLAELDLTIVGMGLMGGSLAGALRGRCRSITGTSRSKETIAFAIDRGLIDKGTTDLVEGVAEANVVILAAPVRVILRQLDEIGPYLTNDCLLMDLGSTKSDIVKAMEKLPGHVQPLGGHPMCGKEISGIEAADPAIYKNATFILSPLSRTAEWALKLGESIAREAGARPLILEAGRQDFLVATVSHLPYLMACGLVGTADATTSIDPAAWQIVAGGFRDTSRLSGSDVTMMVDILLTNRQEVIKAVQVFESQMASLCKLVDGADEAELTRVLSGVRAKRKEMFP
ncbi:MAG: prephenate dehydrogenase [Anaerolineales bacterium]|nr:prephenate dehydrogenase [Anaerolineales bacterium]